MFDQTVWSSETDISQKTCSTDKSIPVSELRDDLSAFGEV